MELEQPSNFWKQLVTFILRVAVPFLLGGISFQLSCSDKQVIVTLKKDLARLEKKIEQQTNSVGTPNLAGPVSLPPYTAKRHTEKKDDK